MSDSPHLSTRLLAPSNRPALIADAHEVLNTEVAKKSGLGGLALKGAYKSVSAISPGFIEGVLGVLLDEWIRAYDEEYTAWQAAGSDVSFGTWLVERQEVVSERMLEVTDRRAKSTSHQSAAKLYWKLRPGAKTHVITALPAVAGVVDRHLDQA
ncbi:MAG: hypothetical protein CL940_12730 [Deltaproteobacteria bacterium]|nr:hypothetical protein [Deltaproteobacteria bacterium]|tara:strand:- start:460 stop:921 length:462 start_codon:yes stop_codon:yes gene_type:complete